VRSRVYTLPVEDLRQTLRSVLAADDGIAWAYLFGSAARGGTFRDVDVAIMPCDGAYGRLVDLGMLAARLEKACGKKVDLVDVRDAALTLLGPLLCERVVLLDADRERRGAWEAEIARRWLDFRPAWERFQEIRAETLRQGPRSR